MATGVTLAPRLRVETQRKTAHRDTRRAISSEADGTRTRNHRIDSQPDESPNPREGRDLREDPEVIAAQTAAPGSDAPHDPELAALIAAWPDLPEPVRAGINAMVRAATGG